MDILNKLIASLNKEDVRHFKLYTARINIQQERKDLQLFDLLRKNGGNYNDEEAFRQLYQGNDKNPYYRLKNRLISDLNKSILLQSFNKDEEVYLHNLMALCRYHYNQNQFELSLHFLKKAEKYAQKLENFELLDIIYGEFIRLSHEILSINPETFIKRRAANRDQLRQLREIDDLLAVISYRLKISQTLSGKNESIISMLENLIEKHKGSLDLAKSAKLRLKLYRSVSQVLLQRQDFQALIDYLLRTYEEFTNDGIFTKSTHDHKLQMLTYIVNALYKTGRTEESLEYAEKLKEGMEEYNQLLFDKYYFFYYNSLVINYSRKDIDKAIAILEKLKTDEKIRNFSFYKVFIYTNLALLLFIRQDYYNAFQHINRLYLLNEYETVDASVKMKIALAELIIRYELGDYDVLRRRLQQVRKDYEEFLLTSEFARESSFLEVLNAMNEATDPKHDQKVQEAVSNFGHQFPTDTDVEEELIDYNEWLAGKVR